MQTETPRNFRTIGTRNFRDLRSRAVAAGALEVVSKLTDEHMEQIEQILDNKPDGYQGYGARFWARSVDTLD